MSTPRQTSTTRLFAERLATHRRRLGLTQEQLADEVGSGQATISSWEKGATSPSIPELLALCELFKLTADFLTGRSDSPHGLWPDQWILDEDIADRMRANPRLIATPLIKVPRRLRIVEQKEAEAIRKELRLERNEERTE